ncbi:hypothetical protein SNEBB_008789 [Seison nebaliae]|nr:hypothetical protein SNEBB_008789 [Seison nebaliae]
MSSNSSMKSEEMIQYIEKTLEKINDQMKVTSTEILQRIDEMGERMNSIENTIEKLTQKSVDDQPLKKE